MEFFSLETIQDLASKYGYWAIFFGIALENMGIPLPGETITIVGGFLAGAGELSYSMVLFTAIAGAVLGDNIGYLIGRKGGWSLLLRVGGFFGIKETELEQARLKFSKNAAKAVFFGRFVALLRIFAGPLAGIAEMPYGQFVLCNLAGATVWASVMVSLSYLLGQIIPLEVLIQGFVQFGLVALFVVVAWLSFPLLWKRFKKS